MLSDRFLINKEPVATLNNFVAVAAACSLHALVARCCTSLHQRAKLPLLQILWQAFSVYASPNDGRCLREPKPAVHANPGKHNSRLNIYQRKIRNIDTMINGLI